MAGTDKTKPNLTAGPVIVLVNPQLGQNIGMVARAMANFGLSELRLVDPRDGWPNEDARAAASRADHVIDGASVFDNLSDAVADCHFVLATSARERGTFKPVLGPVQAAGQLRQATNAGQRAAILFGRERFGLYNEEISRADAIVTFPVNPAFASLNIAQAVLLMSYEWMRTGEGRDEQTPFDGPQFAPAQKHELHALFDRLENALSERGYFRPEAKREVMIDNLRAVLTRPGYSESELKVLHGVISSLDRFSRTAPKGQHAPPRNSRPKRESDP